MSTREIWYRYLVISPAADEGEFHGLSGEGEVRGRGWRTAHAHDERKRTNFWRVYTKTNEPEFARFCPFFAHFWAKNGQKRAKNGRTKTNPGETGRNRKFRRIFVRDRHALV